MPLRPATRTGAEVYAMIMGQIEPDLLVENVMKMNEKYKNEKSEEREARKQRYQKAFVEYNHRFEEYVLRQREESSHYRRQLFAYVEKRAAAPEQAKLAEFDSILSNP